MRTLRNHWQISALTVGLALLVGLFWWRGAEARSIPFLAMLQSSTTTPASERLTEGRRDAAVQLLAEVSLDRDALIALNLSRAQAESLLSTVRTWQANNEARLALLSAAVHHKTAVVYAHEKSAAVGPADAGRAASLALARQDLGTARGVYQAALASLENSVTAALSATQQATWSAIRTGHGQHMPIRMLDLTDAQRLAISDAKQRYDRQHAAAGSAEERAAAVSTWQAALDQILTTPQKAVVQNYQSSLAAASAAVNGAFDTVLAVSAG